MKKYMEEAIRLAKLGIGKVNPNPMVGALVVKNDEIVGRGYHKQYGGPHAEVFAIREAGEKAEGAVVYVTLEPCSHYGKTPPCVELLVKSKIKKCIIGLKDPNPLVSGKGIEILEKNGIEVEVGLLEDKIKKLNRVFLHYINNKSPYFYLKSAITLDGKLAASNGNSKWISNNSARTYVQHLRNEFMGVMVGKNTLLNDNPRLTARIENGENPYRIVIDPYLQLNIDSHFVELSKKDFKSIVITSKEEIEKAKELKKYNMIFIFLPGRIFSPEDIKKKLYESGIDSVLLEGGGELISCFMKSEAIDAGTIFIAPKITGDSSALPFISGRKIESINESIKLKNISYEIFDDNIALHFEGR